jgi:arginyl-tRNA synthetase
MQFLESLLAPHIEKGFESLFGQKPNSLDFQQTRKDFEGDITFVTFSHLRVSRKSPEQTGEALGNYLVEHVSEVVGFNVVKGFLNIVISIDFWKNKFSEMELDSNWGLKAEGTIDGESMVEYSSPNTNKPLHLGHVRNNLLGYSVAELIKASGKKTYRVQIINDRGIHICKSMIAWQKFGNGETPESTGTKGDKLVGNYYVAFDKAYKEEIATLIASGHSEDDAKKQAPIFKEAQAMLLKWEEGDADVISLWKEMNGWVYEGFEETYTKMGVSFDKNYYESDTYILGKNDILAGLEKGVFYQKEDSSVWIDLTEDGLDHKIVLRSDGTSVYMTQDIGTAIKRFQDFNIDELTYVVGNEQDYHFKVLFLILDKLGYTWAKNLHHLSYGMVDLPSGKMKSREGTVVDADDLMAQMVNTAKEKSEELGKLEGYSDEEKASLYKSIGLGALKYYILRVDPKKRILFNPEESIDFNGNTGPFIQYTHARIQSLKRSGTRQDTFEISDVNMTAEEKEIVKAMSLFPEVITQAAHEQSPAIISNYTYDLVKLFNSFYQNHSILNADSMNTSTYRLALASKVADVIKDGLNLLGIDSPDRM